VRGENGRVSGILKVRTAQEMLYVKRNLAKIAHSTAPYTHELSQTGQEDETEVLQIETVEQKMLKEFGMQENMLHRSWVELASVIGEPQLTVGTVAGDFEALPPAPDDAKLLNNLLNHSPAINYVKSDLAKTEAALKRAPRDCGSRYHRESWNLAAQ